MPRRWRLRVACRAALDIAVTTMLVEALHVLGAF
jgi:hypothetical protein